MGVSKSELTEAIKWAGNPQAKVERGQLIWRGVKYPRKDLTFLLYSQNAVEITTKKEELIISKK